MLAGKGDCFSERSQLVADQFGPAFVTGAPPQALLRQGACCTGLDLRAFSRARKSMLSLERAECSYSESYPSSRFGSALVHSSLLNTESLVCSGPCNSGLFPRFSCLAHPTLRRLRRARLRHASVSTWTLPAATSPPLEKVDPPRPPR